MLRPEGTDVNLFFFNTYVSNNTEPREGEPDQHPIAFSGPPADFFRASFFGHFFVDFSVCLLVLFWMVFGGISGLIFDDCTVLVSIKTTIDFSIDFSLILGWILGA